MNWELLSSIKLEDGRMEGWKRAGWECWKDGRLDGWKREEWKGGRLTRIFWITGLCQDKREEWKGGRVEDGRMEGWKVF